MSRTLLIAATVGAAVVLSASIAPFAFAELAAPYANCTEARAAGDEDIPASSPNYQPKLDDDNDGIGCESGDGSSGSDGSSVSDDEDSTQVGDVPTGAVDTGGGPA